jgi:hypothetical protein
MSHKSIPPTSSRVSKAHLSHQIPYEPQLLSWATKSLRASEFPLNSHWVPMINQIPPRPPDPLGVTKSSLFRKIPFKSPNPLQVTKFKLKSQSPPGAEKTPRASEFPISHIKSSMSYPSPISPRTPMNRQIPHEPQNPLWNSLSPKSQQIPRWASKSTFNRNISSEPPNKSPLSH